MGESLLATDPRDKIYGFLGLANGQTRKHITPDYGGKDVAEVYVEAGKYFVETEAVLNILHLVSHEDGEGRVANLPSWCPNFSTGRKTSKLGVYATGRCTGFKNLKLGVEAVPIRASILENTNVLLVEGFCIDTVKDTQEPAWRWWDETPEVGRVSSALQSLSWDDTCFKLSLQTYQNSEDAIEAHSRTLIADVVDGKRCTSNQRELYHSMRDMLEFKAPEKASSAELWKRVMSMSTSQVTELQKYTRSVTAASRDRTFFSTNGGRIGLGPSATKQGDLVYMIRNTWTPFIIRPSEKDSEQFELVGEAYVHGLMYREAFDLVSEDRFQTVRLD